MTYFTTIGGEATMYPNSFYTYTPYYNNYSDDYYDDYYDDFFRQGEAQLINDIQKAINGEFSAIACYKELARMAPTEEERNQILEIRKDEKRHFETFSMIYTNLTGRQPSPQMTEKCANTYTTGLIASFKDEQETVDFYLDLADKTQDIFIKETFRRAAADEQNHAVWFHFFLTSQK
jgi:rubrerythrin